MESLFSCMTASSEKKANCPKLWEHAICQVTIDLTFSPDWLRGTHDFFKPITGRVEANQSDPVLILSLFTQSFLFVKVLVCFKIHFFASLEQC